MCLESHRNFLNSLFRFEDKTKIFDDEFAHNVVENSQEVRLDKGMCYISLSLSLSLFCLIHAYLHTLTHRYERHDTLR